ncbi:MAG: FprA family A-type flavoprotein [Spirochaetaceae bacterium]|jgi:flavorubredoxin|nr:FprA family A-type flavoprotein [Spirochaetaceae bacterium]
MNVHDISEGVFFIHTDIQTSELFQGIWPIPHGVSLNTYVVKGEKIALIDLIGDLADVPQQFEEAFTTLGIGFDAVDYLILNHLEPDHTGWLKQFRERNPHVEIISTVKGINLLRFFFKIDEGLRAVRDGETLDLGNGKRLTFFEAPNIHWPETMVTWEATSRILFSCDAFGSFGVLGCRGFDDEFTEEEHVFFERECLRYYANIVSVFSPFVERGIKKLSGLEIACIAPSHGMVWRENPMAIIDRYLRYASYAQGKGEKEITVIWGSMYGHTKLGLDAVIRGIEQEGVPYTIYRVPEDHLSYVLQDAYKSRGLVLAMPTYEYALFPPMAWVLDMFQRKHINRKTVLRIGSFGWVGGAQKEYDQAVEGLKWRTLPSVEWAGAPSAEDLSALEGQGRNLAWLIRAQT